MRELTETDLNILDVSRRLFLEHGIMNTEMKNIATELGCSRSTLYRHFASKSDILLILAQKALDMMVSSLRIPENFQFICGYDALSWQLHSLMEWLIVHTEEVTFLRDFDCVFTKSYPTSPETENFLHQVSRSVSGSPLGKNLSRGIADGSIRQVENQELLAITLVHGCIAMAQRVMPREQIFISEHGYGQELLRYHVKISLDAIKKN